jgi:hypothetical protein
MFTDIGGRMDCYFVTIEPLKNWEWQITITVEKIKMIYLQILSTSIWTHVWEMF